MYITSKEIGDIVYLKSGSPALMIVKNNISTLVIDCMWFQNGEVRKYSFHPDLLQEADPKLASKEQLYGYFDTHKVNKEE